MTARISRVRLKLIGVRPRKPTRRFTRMRLRMARRAENEERQNSRPRKTMTIQVVTKVVTAEAPLWTSFSGKRPMELFSRNLEPPPPLLRKVFACRQGFRLVG